jgi:hypothetical protein
LETSHLCLQACLVTYKQVLQSIKSIIGTWSHFKYHFILENFGSTGIILAWFSCREKVTVRNIKGSRSPESFTDLSVLKCNTTYGSSGYVSSPEFVADYSVPHIAAVDMSVVLAVGLSFWRYLWCLSLYVSWLKKGFSALLTCQYEFTVS